MFHIIIQKNDQITKSTVELIGDNIIHIVVQTKQKTYPELQIVNPTFQNEKIKFGELDDVVMILMQFKIILALFRFIKSSKIPIPIPIFNVISWDNYKWLKLNKLFYKTEQILVLHTNPNIILREAHYYSYYKYQHDNPLIVYPVVEYNKKSSGFSVPKEWFKNNKNNAALVNRSNNALYTNRAVYKFELPPNLTFDRVEIYSEKILNATELTTSPFRLLLA